MILDLEKCLRFGVDKLSIYNFKLTCHNELKAIEDNESYLKESLYIREKGLFNLEYSITLMKNSNEVKEYSVLTFNPNRIIYGHNIYNSKKAEIDYALDKLLKTLKLRGISIDLSTAKIKDLEININFSVDYQEYYEVFLLMISQLKNPKFFGEIKNSKKFNEKFLDEGFSDRTTRKIIRIYDKAKEVKAKEGIDISYLSRLEMTLFRPSINFFCKKNNIVNQFNYIDDFFIEEIFKYYFERDINSRIDNFLLELSKVLESEYLAFKNTQKLARKSKKKVKYKIYDYLKQFWVFDKEQIISIIKQYDNKHLGQEKRKIHTEFREKENFEKLKTIISIICT